MSDLDEIWHAHNWINDCLHAKFQISTTNLSFDFLWPQRNEKGKASVVLSCLIGLDWNNQLNKNLLEKSRLKRLELFGQFPKKKYVVPDIFPSCQKRKRNKKTFALPLTNVESYNTRNTKLIQKHKQEIVRFGFSFCGKTSSSSVFLFFSKGKTKCLFCSTNDYFIIKLS